MENDEHIVQHSGVEIAAMRARGDGQTDWSRVDGMTDDEVEDAIDRDDEGEFDWSSVQVGVASAKRQLTVRFDADVVDWFKAQGAGYQTRMNAVLRSYVEAKKR
jgi:uncharacterized protein (DUF4415 family)